MATLDDIPYVAGKIALAPFQTIKLMYKLIFETEGNRKSRMQIRKFPGFNFLIDSEQFKNKLAYIMDNFTINELMSISHLFLINNDLDKISLSKTICATLTDLQNLKHDLQREEEEGEEEEEEEEEEEDEVVNGDTYDKMRRNSETMDQIKDAMKHVSLNKNNFHGTVASNEYFQPENLSTNSFQHHTSFSFRDVEDSVRPFDGASIYPVERWVSEFEDLAAILGWSELHKFVFAKKALKGLARLFIQSEPGINSFSQLKKALLEEYSSNFSSAEIHRMMSTTKINRGETVDEYFLKMKEIAVRGGVDDQSLFLYVIDGISDDTGNKMVLFGAKTTKEFKEKLKIYSEVKKRADNMKKKWSGPKQNDLLGKNEANGVRCFNCGEIGHLSRDCTNRNKGMKCFSCQKYGHIAAKCTARQTNLSDQLNLKSRNGTYKSVYLGDKIIEALVDTGSSVNLLKASEYASMKLPPLQKEVIKLIGIGDGEVESLGKIDTNINIDEEKSAITVHVVPDMSMSPKMVLGNDFLKKCELVVNRGTIEKIKRVDNNDITLEPEILMLVEVCNEDGLNVASGEYKQKIEQLVKHYCPSTQPKDAGIKMKIVLSDEEPIYHRVRRLAPLEQKEVDRIIDEWSLKGIIRPSCSDFSSPIVPVNKKDGTLRVCIDYRRLNKKTIKDRYPLPIIDDQIDKLRDAQVFTTLDLRNGFHHVLVDKDSIKYTAFGTPQGQYEFLRTPFGLCNAPAVFQRYVNKVFQDLIHQNTVLTYMDDLIIPAKTFEEGFLRLKIVLERAAEYGMDFNWKKCQFMLEEIEYLGYRISNNNVQPSQAKTSAVQNFPKLTSLKAVQSFLGLTGFFRKFIPKYANVAKPLSDLLKRDNTFKFGPDEENSFNKLKEILSAEPVLKIYCPELYTELHTDASQLGFGAVLMQRDPNDMQMHPIHYMSYKTSETEMKYHSYELEVLAVVKALQKFRVYLLGIEFKILTDCEAFQMTLSKKDISAKVWRWASFMEQFRYSIEHRSNLKMRHCDALSRYPVMITARSEFLERLRVCQEEDENLRTIKELLKTNNQHENYLLQHNLLYKLVDGEQLLAIPSNMQTEIIKKFHDENGHFGTKKIENLITREFWIPKLKQKIIKIIKNCVLCILSEKKKGKQEGWLHPLNKEELPLQTFHIDHLGPLPTTGKGYKYLFVVVDGFTKFVWIYPTKSTSANEVITKLESQKPTFGNPKRIISDRGTAYTSKVFEDYCQQENIELFHITTGVARGNGQVERINGIIIPVLAKLTQNKESEWFKYVPKLQTILNNSFQRSINCTPSELFFGVPLRQREDLLLSGLINEEYLRSYQDKRCQERIQAKQQIQKIQEENKKYYNRRRKCSLKYKLGDLVAIRRTQFINLGKLRRKYLGPYKIVKIKGMDRYDVEKVGATEGPNRTSTSADFMKPWLVLDSDGSEDGTSSGMAELWDSHNPTLPTLGRRASM